MTHLEPIEPADAVELYLKEKESEVSEWTHYSHGSRLGHFLRWCEEEDINDLNNITGRDLKRYKLWRRDDGDINNVTLKTQMDTLRVFIRWCESIDAVTPDLSTKVESPDLDQLLPLMRLGLRTGKLRLIIFSTRSACTTSTTAESHPNRTPNGF